MYICVVLCVCCVMSLISLNGEGDKRELEMADVNVRVNDVELRALTSAVGLAIGSCNRLANRAGAPVSVRDSYLKEASSLEALRSKLLAANK